MRSHIIGQAVLQSYLCLVYFIIPIVRPLCMLIVALAIPIQIAHAKTLPITAEIPIAGAKYLTHATGPDLGDLTPASIRKGFWQRLVVDQLDRTDANAISRSQ